MKLSHDSSGDYKFPVTLNETLSEKNCCFYVVIINACDRVRIAVNSDKTFFFFFFKISLFCAMTIT